MALELRQLRHVLALAQHGSLGRAAVALHMTQPALSRSLKSIESEVGSLLFERSAAGVTPTDQGRLVIRRARELVLAADELDREVMRQRVGGTDLVNVGAGPYAAETIVAATLARFLPDNADVRTRVTIRGNFDELPRLLRARLIDFFVAEFSTLGNHDDLEIQPLERHPGYFVARKDHPLAGAAFAPDDIFEFPFVALAHYPPRALEPLLTTREPVHARRPGRPFPAMECSSVSVAKSVLAASDAIAGLTLPLVADDLRRGSLVLLGTAPWCYVHYGIVSLKGHAQTSAGARFIRELQDAEVALARDEARLIERYSNEPGPRSAKRASGPVARAPNPA
jgi:DNA-binding transcriptional LysR family regulator